jgi:hypothetical protein
LQQAVDGALRHGFQRMPNVIALDDAARLHHRLGSPQSALAVFVVDQRQAGCPLPQGPFHIAGPVQRQDVSDVFGLQR